MTVFFIGLTNGAVYALVALGYTLVYGILELINFAHGDVFMLGGMISATILTAFNLQASASFGSLAPAIIVSLLVGHGHLRRCSTRRSSSSPTSRYAARRGLRR